MGSCQSHDFELEQAIVAPASTFVRPGDVLNVREISDALKARILQSWRLDVHRHLTHSTRDVPDLDEFTTLQEINQALEHLEKKMQH